MKKLVIKVGTNVITKENGLLNMKALEHLVQQIVALRKKGINVILVSSGAMGAGRSLIKLDKGTNDVVRRQVLASIGQVELLKTYLDLFKKHDHICAQVLATKEDFRDRLHYLNMKNCFEALLSNKVIPIVNENDVISVDELMFTDNDELAGLIASMMDIDDLILLSSVDGVLDETCTRVISKIDGKTKIDQCIRPEKSSFGRGGMLTKAKMAQKLASMGITTYVANGETKNILIDLVNGKNIGTKFVAQKQKASNLKRWIAHSEGYEKGLITIDKGAEKALKSKISSLLPVGITKVEGEFKKGDVVKIKNLGFGIAAYSSKTLKAYLGKKNKKPFIHYDYLFLQK
jgi:glutamate 5-kinase